jgi:hypothetical protein
MPLALASKITGLSRSWLSGAKTLSRFGIAHDGTGRIQPLPSP